MALRKRRIAIPAVAAFTTVVVLAPAAAAGTVPVVTTTCPKTLTVATFEPGKEVSGNVTVTSRDGQIGSTRERGSFSWRKVRPGRYLAVPSGAPGMSIWSGVKLLVLRSSRPFSFTGTIVVNLRYYNHL
jgi:hypothetical protein